MGLAEAKTLTASQAISRAKVYFAEFYQNENVANVLLEELNFDETAEEWTVTIGFDVGRKKVKQPSQNALAIFGHDEVSPIREARHFIINDETGELVRMENG